MAKLNEPIIKLLEESGMIHAIPLASTYYQMDDMLRHYHNLQHAVKVMNAVGDLMGEKTTVAAILAALWHDAIYLTGAKNDANEHASIAAMRINMKRLFTLAYAPSQGEVDSDTSIIAEITYETILLEVEEAIKATIISNHLRADNTETLGIGAYLVDADLSSLADPYEEFVQHQINIYLESQLISDVTKTPGIEVLGNTVDFLNKLTQARPSIYQTVEGAERYEALARKNIDQLTSDYLAVAIPE